MYVRGADVEEARKLLINGNYTDCIKIAEKAVADREYDEGWPLILSDALMTVGRYPDALNVISNAIPRYYGSIRLRLAGYEVYRQNGKLDDARNFLTQIDNLAQSRSWSYRDPASSVTLGRAALLMGADPRRVLDSVYTPLKASNPKFRDTYLAEGQLALDKHDFSLASKSFEAGLNQFADDPDMLYGMARAYASSDSEAMQSALEAALTANTNHIPSLLLVVDHLIDAEEYTEANKLLDQVLSINPWQADAWSYRAILQHLHSDEKGENESRDKALKFWSNNPRVDYLIGQKLAQKYRFAEGAARQRQALKFDPAYVPAKIELAEDLLRLGQEEEGWMLANEVSQLDGYDVTAFNLVNLGDTMGKFQTLTNRDFIVRMTRKEAEIYGDRVLDLLGRAKARLCEKYGLTLDHPVTVEIFAEQKDFGVRTFGIPDNPGFLGVCFGTVITANSPASQEGHPSNWEDVLWHEFCHVVTLHITHNKMPRWLSEGISVYEERLANPIWGQRMNPRYREMTMGKDLTPVSELSAAFLKAKSPMHVQFAYYESSLVVEYLVDHYGIEALKKILADLGQGVWINEAIEKNTEPMSKLQADFVAFAQERAKALAPKLDWAKPTPDDLEKGKQAWYAAHPNNYYSLMSQAKDLFEKKEWALAKVPLSKLLEAYPEQIGPDNAYKLLAQAHHNLNEPELERTVLVKWAAIDPDALEAFERLMEIAVAKNEWDVVMQNGERYLAVNPLLAQPYSHLGHAYEAMGKPVEAIRTYNTLLKLDPADAADAHYRLARLLKAENPAAAKRHVLQALEEAPRFRDALQLLLELEPKKEAALPENNAAAVAK